MYTSIPVAMPDWRSEDQNQPKATSIAFVGLKKLLPQGYLALFLIFLLKIRPQIFSVFFCSSRSRDNHTF
jgi:hypothetical protein